MIIVYKKKDVFIQAEWIIDVFVFPGPPIGVAQRCITSGPIMKQDIYIVNFILSITISFFELHGMHLLFIEE